MSADSALLRLATMLRQAGYRFVTPTPASHQRVNSRPGSERARDLRDVFGWSRPFARDLLPDPVLDAMAEAGVLAACEGGWKSTIRVSSLGDDLFVHSAYPTTAPDSVFFGPDTYRFARAVEAQLARREAPVGRAVDIGCGAGPGAIVVAKARPSAEVLMVDINEKALRFAAINAALAGTGNALPRFSDLLSAVAGQFDLIVSNPPYLLDPAERAYRHGGGALGAGLSLAILEAALDRLAPAGTLVLYTGAAIVNGEDPFRSQAAAQLRTAPVSWSYEEVDPDVFGEELDFGPYRAAERIAAVVLTATRQE